MRPFVSRVVVLLATLIVVNPTVASLRLSELFGDGVVLQRNTMVRLWGWTTPGASVRVEASWSEGQSRVIPLADGSWYAFVETPDAGGPHTITVSDDLGHRVTVSDVMIGEVWLCAGQSNMAWTVEQADDTERTLDEADELGLADSIRVFAVPFAVSPHPTRTFRAPPGGWRHATRETLRQTSAVAYHFARTLQLEEGVPVGIIVAAVGGTAIEPWMPMKALEPLVPPSSLDLVRALDRDPAARARNLANWSGDWWQRLDEAPGSSPRAWRSSLEMPANSGWTPAPVPMSPMPASVAAHDGIIELRRTIELTDEWSDHAATLELGPLDDMDDAWINGTLVGSTHVDGAWGTPRRYTVPAGTLRRGTNVIAVRILDTAGPGGAGGTAQQYALRRADGETMPLGGEWALRIGPAMSALPPRDGGPTIDQRTPTALFNAMIRPIAEMTIGGICWYQGESNAPAPNQYGDLLRAMVGSWRELLRTSHRQRDPGIAPMLVVQLAPFNWRPDRGHWALIREAQASVLDLPMTGLVVTLDVGNPKDIHPGDKRTVGERLGRLARAVALGRDLPAHAPRMVAHERDGHAIRVRFEHIGDGLWNDGDHIEGVTIAGADRRFVVARAEIDRDALVVSSPLVPDPVAVRYAWSASPVATLVNVHGMPVAPFRTDTWPMPEGGWLPPEDEGRTPWLIDDETSAAAGFVPLFNGVDLNGWENINCAPETFAVRTNVFGQSVIFCTGAPICVLRTEEMARNFVLEMEYRHLVPGGNAGLFVWSDGMTARGQPFTRSVEVQVLDGQEGDWYTSDGDIFPIHGATMVPENGRGGDRAFPTERRVRPAPLWNHYLVTCVDGNITLAVNGAVVTQGREASPREGYICLESEGSPIEFRNLRLRRHLAGDDLPREMIADHAEGFEPLYTGVDLRGWHSADLSQWQVRDWILACVPTVRSGDAPDAALWTDEEFGDFEMIVDWRLPREPRVVERPLISADGRERRDAEGRVMTESVADAGDSGIYLRGSSKAQVNIWSWPVGSGEVYGYRTDESMPDNVRASVTPSQRADRPPGQWNRFRVRMEGDRLTVDLNGVRVIDAAHLPGVPARGPIGLQHHGDPVEFANIMIRPLDRTP